MPDGQPHPGEQPPAGVGPVGAMQSVTPRDLLRFEYAEREQSGYDVSAMRDAVEALLADDRASDEVLLTAYRSVIATEQDANWPYDEPDDLNAILDRLPAPTPPARVDTSRLAEQLHGAWLVLQP